jgi:hypothetical protein
MAVYLPRPQLPGDTTRGVYPLLTNIVGYTRLTGSLQPFFSPFQGWPLICYVVGAVVRASTRQAVVRERGEQCVAATTEAALRAAARVTMTEEASTGAAAGTLAGMCCRLHAVFWPRTVASGADWRRVLACCVQLGNMLAHTVNSHGSPSAAEKPRTQPTTPLWRRALCATRGWAAGARLYHRADALHGRPARHLPHQRRRPGHHGSGAVDDGARASPAPDHL